MTKESSNITDCAGKNHNAEAAFQIIGSTIIMKDRRQERIPIIL